MKLYNLISKAFYKQKEAIRKCETPVTPSQTFPANLMNIYLYIFHNVDNRNPSTPSPPTTTNPPPHIRCGLNKMVDIFQATFSNAFSWKIALCHNVLNHQRLYYLLNTWPRKMFPFDDDIMICVKSTSTQPKQHTTKHESYAWYSGCILWIGLHEKWCYFAVLWIWIMIIFCGQNSWKTQTLMMSFYFNKMCQFADFFRRTWDAS